MNELPIPRDPTEDEAIALFTAVQELFPSKTLGTEKWYLLTVRSNRVLLHQALTLRSACSHCRRWPTRICTSPVQGAHQET